MSTRVEQHPDGADETHEFLNPQRIQEIGAQIAPLLLGQLSWIERRKESVQILDDTALRRHTSVDFSLRSAAVDPLLPATDSGQALYCAPLFVLPKLSGRLMAFDLRDGDDHSLRLIAREDNAEISAAALTTMAEIHLTSMEMTSSAALCERLQRIARAEDVAAAERLAQRVVSGSTRHWEKDRLVAIRQSERLCWWIRTLAHSSIVVVLYRAYDTRRQLIKLSFDETFDSEARVPTRLGWQPYQVAIDSPLIEARSYHFEASAPPGLRIANATLADARQSTPSDPERPSVRRVHLYRRRAQDAGAATAYLRIVVSGPGFVGGGFLAASLTFLALLACALLAANIASNPTSAPALLLVLPALIATYVGRGDQHALTTRLLSWARRALLLSAFCAYVAAGKVALGGGKPKTKPELHARTTSLHEWLYTLAGVSLLSLIILGVTFVRARVRLQPLRDYLLGNRVSAAICIPRSPEEVLEHLRTMGEPRLLPEGYALILDADKQLLFARETLIGTRVATCKVEEADEDSVLHVTVDFLNSWLPVQLPPTVLKVKQQVEERLELLAQWARSTQLETRGPQSVRTPSGQLPDHRSD